MSKRVLERLSAQFGAKILETSSAHGDETAVVAPGDWLAVAKFLRDDSALAMDHFVDLTAVDFPLREPERPRFDVVLHMRSMTHKHRVRLKTRVKEDEPIDSLVSVWVGANWAERETWDMFGIKFRNHPDLRRILMYEEFVGYPLRKDYPIDRAQPLVPYRAVEEIEKLPPFGPTEGQPFGRIDWRARLGKQELQVSPALGLQTGERRALSDGTEHLPEKRISTTEES